MEEKDKILLSAINVLNDKRIDIFISLKRYRDELDECIKNREELNNMTEEDIDAINTPETDRLFDSLSKFGKGYAVAGKLIDDLNIIQSEIRETISYDVNIGSVSHFIELVDKVEALKIDTTLETINYTSKLSGTKSNIKERQFDNINESIKRAKAIQSFYVNADNSDYSVDRDKVISDIKSALSLADFNTFDKTRSLMSQIQIKIDKKMDEVLDKIAEAKANEMVKREESLNKRVSDIKKKFNECQEQYEIITDTLEKYDSYLKSEDPDILLSIINSLSKIGAIKERDAKKLRYIKQEKNEPKEIINQESKEIIKKEENINKEFSLDYYKDKDAQNIICFIGRDEDSFFDDIDNYFDNSSRPIVIKKLNELFNNLYSNKNFITRTGGNPHEGTNEKVKELLSRPFDFDYRRYGTGKDPYRIHAITRHSDLLEKLEYGNGNIIFFGAVGPNDTTQKSFTYSRLGNRAIRSNSENGLPATLRSNFDSIEHITRGYIPINLLSYEDKSKYNRGEFNNKLKGSKDKMCESKYVLYDVLDDYSKKNVKVFLDDYFEKQSLKMFDIINEYKDIMNRGSLD